MRSMSASSGGVGSALNYVDNQIHEDGVDRLKLLMYAVLKPVWKELAKCEKASEIYHMLEGHLGSKEKAMQMFLFALKAIGGSKRGKQSAKEVSQVLRPPKELEFEQQTDMFRFFFWLLKVARRLPDECHEKLKRHFARTEKINPRFIKSTPQLFIKLYHDKVLSERDTSPLMKVLEEYEECYEQDTPERKNVRKCMAYLHKFHDGETDPFSSGDEESSAPSMCETDANAGHEEHPAIKSKATRRQKKRKKFSESTSVSYQFVFEPEDTPAPKDSSDSPSPTGCSPPKDIQGLDSPRLEGSGRLFHPVSGSTPCAASVGTITSQDRVSGQSPGAEPRYQSTGAASVDGHSTAWGQYLDIWLYSSGELPYICKNCIINDKDT